MATTTYQKSLGAFYTGEPVARWIVKWAVRSPGNTVLDPSCGVGVFLDSASKCLDTERNGHPLLWGIDVDAKALRSASERVAHCKLLNTNFFSIQPGDLPGFDAVVGNPPFIRYQSFIGESRLSALARAKEAGVHLPQLSSSWAPFIVHATSFLKKGGRLGMVVPVELTHAQYAREVLKFVAGKFGRIQLSIFRRKLFPDLSEDTGVLLCEEYGSQCTWFSIAILNDIHEAEEQNYLEQPVNVEDVLSGKTRLTHYLLPPKVRGLYLGLAENSHVRRIGTAADIGIGYVTGCNDFFHVSLSECREWKLPSALLKPALLAMNGSCGALLLKADWAHLRDAARKAYLLAIPPVAEQKLPGAVREYLRFGERLGVPTRFKCRVRQPWYSVPHVRVADAFLSYMSGQRPRLVGNRSGVVAPNTLHLVRFERGEHADSFIGGWFSSLTRLSCELEGHPLGGGMLKLEPTEAERVLVALPGKRESSPLLAAIDKLIRGDTGDAAADLADLAVLRRGLALSASECVTLRDAAVEMQNWRMHK
jgi:adenine-specific DNA methylase